MENILERLKRGDIILGDGAFGTLLMQRGLEEGDPPEAVNLSEPQYIEEISSIYLEAGAEIITTNTIPIAPQKIELLKDKIKVLSIAPLLGEVIIRAHEGRSVGEMFDE